MTTETTSAAQSFWRAAPLPTVEDELPFDLNATVAYHCAMYVAHMNDYRAKSRPIIDALPSQEESDVLSVAERDAVGAPLRALIVDHLQPADAAWTAAALLKGWTAKELYEHGWDKQLLDELAWQWLGETTDLTSDQMRALTTTPIRAEGGLY